MAITFDECDYCGSVVAGRKVDITYVREDGDENVLCIPCQRVQLEEDYKRDENKERNEK